jgi:hypothetical protein
MRRLLEKPGVWLLLQAAVLLVVLVRGGQFVLQRQPDSHFYEIFQTWPLGAALSQMRTFGYPLFLSAARLPSRSLSYLPLCQFLFHLLAVLVFYRGLRLAGVAPWTALVVASPLLYARTMTESVGMVQADLVAASLAVITAGLLLAVLGRPRSRTAWAGVTLSLFLTYQTRPAYLFLVALVPLLGWLLPFVGKLPAGRADRRHVAVGLTAAALLPLLAFCCLRWAAVGHFGVVSFGGRNLIGIAGQFLQERDVGALPPDLARLARTMLTTQAELEARGEWKAAVHNNSIDYATMSEMYNTVCHRCYSEAVVQNYPNCGDGVLVNGLATRLSTAVIREHPRAYWHWLRRAFWEGGGYLVQSATNRWVFVRLFLLLFLLHAAACLRPRPVVPPPPAPPGGARGLLGLMALLGVGFALANLVLVILVEVPLPRYLDAAGIFLPSVVSAAVCLSCAPRDEAPPSRAPGEAKV